MRLVKIRPAYRKALQVRAADNDTAHAGLAALTARHDFATALTQVNQALAITP
jgi:hypothetical protein